MKLCFFPYLSELQDNFANSFQLWAEFPKKMSFFKNVARCPLHMLLSLVSGINDWLSQVFGPPSKQWNAHEFGNTVRDDDTRRRGIGNARCDRLGAASIRRQTFRRQTFRQPTFCQPTFH
jgi:hypothetical protein